MIPTEEIDQLMDAVDEAIGLAAEGRIGAGYQLLSNGWLRAKMYEVSGEAWGAELLARWRQACDVYAESYGVAITENP